MINLKRLDIDDAHLLIDGAREKSLEMGVPMCIAIADESGNLIAFERMDGGKTASVIIAQEKAFTAAAARKATHEYNAACVPGSLVFGIHTSHDGKISTVGGGIPITFEGQVVGGIGVSSGLPEQDIECAEAGISYWMSCNNFQRNCA